MGKLPELRRDGALVFQDNRPVLPYALHLDDVSVEKSIFFQVCADEQSFTDGHRKRPRKADIKALNFRGGKSEPPSLFISDHDLFPAPFLKGDIFAVGKPGALFMESQDITHLVFAGILPGRFRPLVRMVGEDGLNFLKSTGPRRVDAQSILLCQRSHFALYAALLNLVLRHSAAKNQIVSIDLRKLIFYVLVK